MTTQAKHFDEWLDKAFQLAFFLHNDRERAKRITVNAMNKLETASNAQFKRHYYTPTGRSEHLRAARSRVSLNDLQILQRLVFVESEIFERENEAAKNITVKILLNYFIKHLVRISLKRNSFYVTLGVSRILHNYATADAMEIYNLVIQDPERVHDDYYYRSRKGVLMKELKVRFEDLIETVKVNRGEERFQTETGNRDLNETAKECLEFFTPWSSKCSIPEKFDPFEDIIESFYFDKKDPDEEHRIEINRIHAALHPCCFARLADALNLPAPEKKMEIPKFMINTNQAEFDDTDWRNPPPLEADELRQIKDILAAQAESRKALTAGFLCVAVDGAEYARINLNETDSARMNLDESAELIEVYGDNETLLATHLLSFAQLKNGNQSQSVIIEGGQKITFDFAPEFDESGEISQINLAVGYAETAWRKRFAAALRRAGFAASNVFGQPVLKPVLAFGLIILAVGFGWFILRNSGEKEELVIAPPQNQTNEIKTPELLPAEEKKEIVDNDASPKNLKETIQTFPEKIEKSESAANQKTRRQNKPPVLPKKEILPENTPKQLQAVNNEKRRRQETGTDKEEILRLPIREKNDFPQQNITRRGSLRKNAGKSLNEIKQIYIEITGDEILGAQIAGQISDRLGKSGRFVVTDDKEQADAALKIYIRHESDVDEPEEKMVTAIVRLVNVKGFVVYPNRKGISGWKYIGEIAKLPARIAQDLTTAR